MTQTPKHPKQSNQPPTPQSLFDDDNDEYPFSLSPTKQHQVSTQEQWESNYTDNIQTAYNPDNWTTQIDGLRKRQTSKRGVNPKRAGKTFDKLKVKPDDYDFTAIPPPATSRSVGDMTEYYKHFTDILINGNLRFKFIPKCSTRKGATQYCASKFDDRGYPKYRLIEANARDPFGNAICDLNGDKVDDIIICDKRGVPVIVNGYRLVRADPYKKTWKGMYAKGKTKLGFNEWLAEQFAIKKDWSNFSEEDWKRGKLDWDLTDAKPKAQTAYNHFVSVGLGKPRLNTRLNPRALWSSLFSKFIWKNAIFSFRQSYADYTNIPNIFSYLKIVNAAYIILIEIPTMEKLRVNKDYVAWVRYKNDNKSAINGELGKLVQAYYTTLAQEVQSNTESQSNSAHTKISSVVIKIIKACSFIDTNKAEAQNLNTALEDASTEELKYYKQHANQEIDNYLENKISGYLAYVSTKPKKVSDFDTYTTMRLKGVNQSSDDDDDSQEA